MTTRRKPPSCAPASTRCRPELERWGSDTMKRTLYRRLHKQARHSAHRDWRAVTAVWTVSDPEVPRWSPGDGWVEVATARVWVRATDSHKGLMCTCLVHAWHRSDANPGHTEHPV